MALTIHTSNRIENLVDALAETLKVPLAAPFAPELIVMQSKGMQRWLAMELAARFGVWANCVYPFPNALVADLFELVAPDHPVSPLFSPDVMTWQIFGMLPAYLEQDSFAPLQRYLADDRDELKRFQLAGKIADTFDQYTLYRPELLARWESGRIGDQEEQWQAILWQELSLRGNGCHRGRLKQLFCSRLPGCRSEQCGLPERVALFGISYLPAYHLEIIAAVAQITEVNLFLLSPTREYWADIVSRKGGAGGGTGFEGNPLLASLGRLGRDFSDMTIELGNLAAREQDLYQEPAGTGLLHHLQSAILNLTGSEEGRELQVISRHDRSVQIHSCHSPMREVEVLHDQLLYLLEHEPGLEPRDILVMTPDIEAYSSYITAVFGCVQQAAQKIPFSIADRRLASEGVVASVLLQLLALPDSRLTVVQLLDILSAPPVLRCFELEEGDLPTIRDWLEATAVRWGIDEQDRLKLGLPGYRSHSWRAGLDRLLLGYAMAEAKGASFNGIQPYDAMEGSSVQLLGKLIDFVNRVEQAVAALAASRPLAAWCRQLHELLAAFVVPDNETAHEMGAISSTIAALTTLEQQSGFTAEVPFALVRSWLTTALEQEEKGLGFMTGGVTFCAMLPLRSIPFKVIAMIGMHDGAFPRRSVAPGFDLIAQHPRRGDRSLRDEDRYLFLETLLSARTVLYMSYVGQSIRDNSEIPPSVLISELLDAVQRGYCCERGTPEQHLITRHRLQAFSRHYFTKESELFSYSEENCAALLDQYSGIDPEQRFISQPLAEATEEWRDVSLRQLLRFIGNPARYFLENRLGVRLVSHESPLDEREPFAAEGLSGYSVKAELLELILQGDDPELLRTAVRSRGLLPPAQHGELLFSGIVEETGAFSQKVLSLTGTGDPLPQLDFSLDLNRFRLHGRLDRVWPEQMVRYRCAKMKARDQLTAWIEHLVLNALQQSGYPCRTTLVMTDKTVSFSPVEDAAELLQELLGLYWQGLSAPLPFFPESSLAYATAKPPWDISKALGRWRDGYNDTPGEGSDLSFRTCFGRQEPFDEEFERISQLLLSPLLRHRS